MMDAAVHAVSTLPTDSGTIPGFTFPATYIEDTAVGLKKGRIDTDGLVLERCNAVLENLCFVWPTEMPCSFRRRITPLNSIWRHERGMNICRHYQRVSVRR
jgi:hypothetical protein